MDGSITGRGLDQIDALVASVTADQLDDPTPCDQWAVRQLVAHIVEMPARLTAMIHHEKVERLAVAQQYDDPLAAFRGHATGLLAAVSASDEPVPEGLLAAELAVHAWDLASAIGRDSSELDAEIAQVGLDFVTDALTGARRGNAFGPQRQAPDGANVYERLAAFTGRDVPFAPQS